jgi:hypothetical protein
MATKILETKIYIEYCPHHNSWCDFTYEITQKDFTGRIKYRGNRVFFEIEVPYIELARKKFLGFIPYSGDKRILKKIWKEDNEIAFVNKYEEVIVECAGN